MKVNLLKTVGAISCSLFLANVSIGQITFANKNSSLHSDAGVLGSNSNVRSSNCVAVIDVNFDGLDDIVKLDNNRYVRIEYQQVGGTFNHVTIGDFGNVGPWSMCVSDVDHNGYKDVLAGGGSQVYLMKLNNTGTGMLGTVTSLPNGNIFSQNANFMDVNNDGWEDIFVCNDVNESRIWVNDGTGNFPTEQANSVIDFDVTPGTAAPNDESGNYGSVWTDFDNDGDVDFYIAHCRQSYGPGDLRRTNVLFENNGNGTYTSNAAAHNLASNDQDWTASFGDIDNDGDFDLFMTKHDVTSRYYFNTGGNFTVSPNTIAFGSMPMQSQFEDLDNDGFIDLIITGDNDDRIYHNNGNGTFTDVTPANVSNGSNMLSFATGDLNHDGKIDIYASYGTTYNNPSNSTDDIYWQNSTVNGNHFLTLNIVASISNKSGLGVRAYIYGPWGVQTREVRAGESYGTINSSQLHFGLGATTTIDSVVVNWPAGSQTVIANPAADQFLNVLEVNPCTLSGASISPSGTLTMCSGDNVDLTANAAGTGAGYTYQWSNGATTQTINVTTGGTYAVTIIESAQCQSTSSNVTVVVDPVETPTIAAATDTVFCQGDSVLLTSTAASAYLWSNGATTQSIYATTSGNYSVQTQGLCQQWNSNVISVNTHPAPAPSANDVTLSTPSSATLTATGNSMNWYASPSGGTALASGPSYTTPTINADTVFYVQDEYYYGGATGSGGPGYHFGTSLFSGNTTNAALVFNVNQACKLKSVKVYTDQAGVRTIELRNSTGTVLLDTTLNIPLDTTVINLNWNLPVGTAMQLGTNTAQNNTSFGFNSPRLRRTNNAVIQFPYDVTAGTDVMASITGTTQSGTLYYYFYDWQIEKAPVVCVSPMTPVHVYLNQVGISKINNDNLVQIYPNPATDHITVSMKNSARGDVKLSVVDMLGKVIYVESYENSANTKTISTKALKAGVYELNIETDGKIYHSKFVVQ